VKHFQLNKALLPISWIYGLGVCLRNKLFDWRILPIEEFSVPVISIGNLAAGGTGKTPHTEFLIDLLSKKYRIAVLSRGYKRKTSGFILADSKSNSQTIGDEPMQMFRKFPKIQVAVDSDRRRGIKNLLKLPEEKRPEVILLDDAFQHRYVKPSLSILLTESKRLFYNDYLLPTGHLREAASNYVRADIIIVTKCSESMVRTNYQTIEEEMNLLPKQELFFSTYDYKSLLPLFPSCNSVKKESLERLKKEKYSFVLVTGFAHPDEFINYLENFTSDLQSLVYPDHHSFNRKDTEEITEMFNRINNNHKIIITSEKDAVRLTNNSYLSEQIKPLMYYLPIKVTINQEELFTQKIENHVTTFKRNRILA
jgi:tetraacyldisaccharide 4'-kinase